MRKAGKKTQEPEVEDISQQFCKGAMEIMMGFYRTEEACETPKMPRAKPQSSNRQEKLQPFSSRVVDLKLKRLRDKNNQINSDRITELPDLAAQCADSVGAEIDNIPELFSVEQANRDIVPRHIAAEQKREREEQEKKAALHARNIIDWDESRRQQQARLRKAKEEGVNRAKKRAERMLNAVTENDRPNRYYQMSSASSRADYYRKRV